MIFTVGHQISRRLRYLCKKLPLLPFYSMLIGCLAEQWGQVKSSCYHFASTSSSKKMTRKRKCVKSRLHFQLNVLFGVVYYVYILYVSLCVDGTFRPALICKVSKHFTWYDISQINLNKWNNPLLLHNAYLCYRQDVQEVWKCSVMS